LNRYFEKIKITAEKRSTLSNHQKMATTTDLVGKENRPQLMVFFTQKIRSFALSDWANFNIF